MDSAETQQITPGVHTLRCLAGHDVCRELGSIVVVIDADGAARDYQWGEPLYARLGGPLRGWGTLDCDESVMVGPRDGSWHVNVPRNRWPGHVVADVEASADPCLALAAAFLATPGVTSA